MSFAVEDFMGSTFDETLMADTGIQSRAKEKAQSFLNQAKAFSAGIEGLGTAIQGNFQAEAIEAEGAAGKQMAIADGFGQLASGLAGGIGSMPGASRGIPSVTSPSVANSIKSGNTWAGAPLAGTIY